MTSPTTQRYWYDLTAFQHVITNHVEATSEEDARAKIEARHNITISIRRETEPVRNAPQSGEWADGDNGANLVGGRS